MANFYIGILLLVLFESVISSAEEFSFNGFANANLSLTGNASINSDGLMALTNATQQAKGQAFYPRPLHFKSPALNNTVYSFSAAFVFAIVSDLEGASTFGFTFAISSVKHPPGDVGRYLGLLNDANNGNASNHILAVELDTTYNPEFYDIDDNHLGIDINSMISVNSSTAGYYASDGGFRNLSLYSGDRMQVWVEYNATTMQLNVTLAPTNIMKPKTPLLSSFINLSNVLLDPMYVGFTAAEGNILTRYYILGWSFKINGEAPPINLSSLPSVPQRNSGKKSRAIIVWLPISASVLSLLLALAFVYLVARKKKFAELLEDWEEQYGPQRIKYKDIYYATDGFNDSQLLGSGGFGSVYRGVLRKSNIQIAVKKVSHESRQGIKEFVAEVVSIGRIRHRNLVRLLGYCRREGELLLVYDYMLNGSLDRYLFKDEKSALNWEQRFQIIKGIAACLVYLHEDWEQVVIHRDIKASNVLLDGEFNARLGDFGLARLYDHGTDPHTTHVVGTMGYLAPELARRGKATTKIDVFSFGVFLLEVACGKRPIDLTVEDEPSIIDWVLEKWKNGEILEASDHKLDGVYDPKEVELVLKLGMICCHPLDSARPSMRQVLQFLDGDAPLPEISPANLNSETLSWFKDDGFDDYMISYSSSTVTPSVLSGGR